MPYQHSLNEKDFPHPLGKIVCVGRNYAEHAKELNNPVPSQPILFIKPATAAVSFSPNIAIPANLGSCHHELEISVLIGKTLCNANEEAVIDSIAGLGLGLDLTLRDIQQQLKDKSHPWERAFAKYRSGTGNQSSDQTIRKQSRYVVPHCSVNCRNFTVVYPKSWRCSNDRNARWRRSTCYGR
jgi:hypothetical protein